MRPYSHKARMMMSAAVALGVTVSAVAVAPSALAEPTSSDAIISETFMTADGQPEAGVPRNYAVNLSTQVSDEQFATAKAQAEARGGVVLADYPQLKSFFVQASQGDFAGQLNNALAGVGIPTVSIGPTRQAPVSGAEVVVPAASSAAIAAARGSAQGVESQLDDYFVPDPESSRAWGLTAIGALEAQQVNVPLEPVTVAILDTGIDARHPDLQAQVDASKSVGCQVNGIANTAPEAWADDHYHGTHVAGTVAAAHNALGVDGVAPKVTLAAVKTSNGDGMFYPEYVTCGFMWSATHDIDVTNNSYYVDPWAYWIPNEPSQAAGYEVVKRAVEFSETQGLVNIAAEGNSDDDHDNPTTDNESPNDMGDAGVIRGRNVVGGIDIPSMLPNVISVSAVALPEDADPATAQLIRSSFSNYGANSIEIAAPGSQIYSTIPMNYRAQWGNLSGTSMASPHVAGVAGLLKAIHPNASATQIRDLLKKQAGYTYGRLAEPTDGKEYRGAGLVNALAAVLKDQPQPAIGTVEYSTDNMNWQPLESANINASEVFVRAAVQGPVTSATLDLGALGTFSATGDGSFDGSLVVASGKLDLAAVVAPGQTASFDVKVSAFGRNMDVRADDDTATQVTFSVARASQVAPEVKPDPEVKPETKPVPDSTQKKASVRRGKSGALARTGGEADSVLFAAFILVMIGTAVTVTGSRVRSQKR